MDNLTIENLDGKMILTINKNGFDENYLIDLINRLKIEELANKADFELNANVLSKELNENWWKKNGKYFLRNVKE